MTSEEALAVKLHNMYCSCPVNQRKGICRCGFKLNPKKEEWFSIPQNKRFLILARRCQQIMENFGYSEEDSLSIAEDFLANRFSFIPEKIIQYFNGV